MSRSRFCALLALLSLPLLVFHRALFFGEAFLPADLLSYLSPWKAAYPPAPNAAPWNVLRFDGIAQFYPWRLEAARQWRAGHVPLWNPHQFAADGGTPLLANSQSAPLYPLNFLFALAPPRFFWYVFGLLAAIHLFIAAAGLYALLRSCGLRRGACVFGAAAWALSGPVVCWLALPTFLAVSCWIPWLLLLIRRAAAGDRRSLFAAGGIAGVMILAGHLQVALYGVLCALVCAAFYFVRGVRSQTVVPVRFLGGTVAVAALALCLSAPQVLPALELSRVSHRAVAEKSLALYAANNGSAFPPRNMVTLLAPDFYGHPNRGAYWNDSDRRDASGRSGNNYGEWAAYVGVLPLVLALFAAALPLPKRPDRLLFAILALLAGLIATGTPLNLLLFYAVPGYAALANPGRVLVVYALGVCALAAFGLDALFDADIPAPAKRRAALIAVAVPLFAAAWGVSLSAAWAREAVPATTYAALLAQATPGLIAAAVLLALSAVLLFAAPRLAMSPPRARVALAVCCVAVVADLAAWGYDYNPSGKPEQVYPVTPGIAFLQKNAATARIAVLNNGWTLGQTAPARATLPPNALTVYGLHDIGGYDSLFRKGSKDAVTAADGGRDASPPANGNMVFVKGGGAAHTLGANYLVCAPSDDRCQAEEGVSSDAPVYAGDDLLIYRTPNPVRGLPSAPPVPKSFRLGILLAACALGTLAADAFFTLPTRFMPRARKP